MKTSTVALAVICICSTLSTMAMSQNAAVNKCKETMTSKMATVMSENRGASREDAKKKTCPLMEDFLKCALKAQFKERPAQSELDAVQKMAKTMNAGPNSIDCGVNIKQMADDIWNAAGVARPYSLFAVSVSALGVFLVSRVV